MVNKSESCMCVADCWWLKADSCRAAKPRNRVLTGSARGPVKRGGDGAQRSKLLFERLQISGLFTEL